MFSRIAENTLNQRSLLGCILIPESPVWLNSKGRYVNSMEASKWLHLALDSKPKLDSGDLERFIADPSFL